LGGFETCDEEESAYRCGVKRGDVSRIDGSGDDVRERHRG
jgi:hypothetical protein